MNFLQMMTDRCFTFFLVAIVAAFPVGTAGTKCDPGAECRAGSVAQDNVLLQMQGALKSKDIEDHRMAEKVMSTQDSGEDGEDSYLSELTLLAGSADDNVNLTAAALKELGWIPGVMIADTTHEMLGMLDHAWTFSKNGKCVAVFAATNDKVDQHQVLSGLDIKNNPPKEFCGFQVHAGLVDEMAGFMKADNWKRFTTFLNSEKCTSVTSVGHSLGASLATVFAGCANRGANVTEFGDRTDYGLVTFAAFAVSTTPMYSGTEGTPFNGMRYGITASDGGASSSTPLPDDTKQFRLDLLNLFVNIAAVIKPQVKPLLETTYAKFEKLPTHYIEAAWGQIESLLIPFLLPTFLFANQPPKGLEFLQKQTIATAFGMVHRKEVFYTYDPISSLSGYYGFKHALVDFQPLSHPLKDGTTIEHKLVLSHLATELPKSDAFQSVFGILGNRGFFPNHQLCCYSTDSDCKSKFNVTRKACTAAPCR